MGERVSQDVAAYTERISSPRTEALFLTLTLLFLALALWRLTIADLAAFTIILFGLGGFFLFYSLNYRTLTIRLTSDALQLRFGLFNWSVALDDVADCFLDKTSLWRIGGAGIHFSLIGRRYRAMFNFLEYPRVVIALKEKEGLSATSHLQRADRMK
jgi:hypothetical protein